MTEIEKVFEENALTCNMCFEPLQNQGKINPEIHIIWTEIQKYRVFTNFHCSFLDNLFRRKNIKEKYGGTSQETIEIYINYST